MAHHDFINSKLVNIMQNLMLMPTYFLHVSISIGTGGERK